MSISHTSTSRDSPPARTRTYAVTHGGPLRLKTPQDLEKYTTLSQLRKAHTCHGTFTCSRYSRLITQTTELSLSYTRPECWIPDSRIHTDHKQLSLLEEVYTDPLTLFFQNQVPFFRIMAATSPSAADRLMCDWCVCGLDRSVPGCYGIMYAAVSAPVAPSGQTVSASAHSEAMFWARPSHPLCSLPAKKAVHIKISATDQTG